MNEENLYTISYVSSVCDCLRKDDVQNILQSSTSNNKELGITGMLAYCNNHFFQIIEGEKDNVIELYEKIRIDCRHDGVIKLEEGIIKERHFEKWSMAFKSFNKELKDLDNFNTEEFYTYINTCIAKNPSTSLLILRNFFDLNG